MDLVKESNEAGFSDQPTVENGSKRPHLLSGLSPAEPGLPRLPVTTQPPAEGQDYISRLQPQGSSAERQIENSVKNAISSNTEKTDIFAFKTSAINKKKETRVKSQYLTQIPMNLYTRRQPFVNIGEITSPYDAGPSLLMAGSTCPYSGIRVREVLSIASSEKIEEICISLLQKYPADYDVIKLALLQGGVKKNQPFGQNETKKVAEILENIALREKLQNFNTHAPWASRLSQKIDGEFLDFDINAKVFNHSIFTDFEQVQVVHGAFETANKLVIATSYGIKPKGCLPDDLPPTMVAFLRGFAERQYDKDFTAIFFYQKSNVIQNCVTGCVPRTQVSIKENDWLNIINVYNEGVQTKKVEGKPINNIKASLYFMAGEPSNGPGGSQHSKFIINDNGLCITLGASIANKPREHWVDAGVITVSPKLSKYQLKYFTSHQQQEATSKTSMNNHVAKIAFQNGKIFQIDPITSRNDYLKKMPARFETAQNGLESIHAPNVALFIQGFSNQGFDLGDMNETGVFWVNNQGSTQISGGGEKPIGIAFKLFVESAKEGDTLMLRHANGTNFVPFVNKLIANALEKGVKVEILSCLRHIRIMDPATLRRNVKKHLKGSKDVMSGLVIKDSRGNQGITDIAKERGWQPVHSSVLVDHAKLYGIKRTDGSTDIMVGTYNLDGQSVLRSNENVQILHEPSGEIIKREFKNYFECGCKK